MHGVGCDARAAVREIGNLHVRQRELDGTEALGAAVERHADGEDEEERADAANGGNPTPDGIADERREKDCRNAEADYVGDVWHGSS